MCLFNAVSVIVKGSLITTMLLLSCPFLWFSSILPAIAYGSSSNNNSTYAGYTVNCQKKFSYRSPLGQRKMPWLYKGRVKTTRQWVLSNELRWRNCPDKIRFKSHHNLRGSASVLFAATANYLFSKYRFQAPIFKIPASWRPLLN